MKAFLGMGLLGSHFVRAIIKKGDEVQVWNRTASKASELEKYGARSFSNVTDAVKGADIIHLTLKDDASVNEVLEAASSGLMPGAIIIDHTTTTKEGAIQRTKDSFTSTPRYLWAPQMHWKVQALCYYQAIKNLLGNSKQCCQR
jgi:3-hydroxyisobutyrate dehydrogenase